MYLRFVVPSLGRYRWGLIGIIQAAFDLKDAGSLSFDEELSVDLIEAWFKLHLPTPRRFTRSRRRGAAYSAICWFKPTASESIRKARALASLLEARGLATQMISTRKPGYVVYEDEYQVAAVPFHDTHR